MSKNNYTNYHRYSIRTEEKTEPKETNPENAPEEEIEKTNGIVFPETAELLSNVYLMEKPYGDKIPKDELDRVIASKVIEDSDGYALVPQGTRIEVYDVYYHENGSIWYGCRFGYLMAKDKYDKEFIK